MDNSHTNAVKALYKDWASLYDDSATKGLHYLVEEGIFIQTVHPEKDDWILDVGCGTGRNIVDLLKYSKNVEGLDISPEMINVARKKFPMLNFYEADIEEKIPVEDQKYDKITCSLTFQFLKDIAKPLQEFKRILKKGGRAYITDFINDAPILWSDVEYKVERKFKGSPSGVSTFRSKEEYLSAFKESGFVLEELVPLVVREGTKEVLTEASYQKTIGKWATVIFVVRSR